MTENGSSGPRGLGDRLFDLASAILMISFIVAVLAGATYLRVSMIHEADARCLQSGNCQVNYP